MPTLRDRVRETLSATEPSDKEAARDLAKVLARGKKRPIWPLIAAPALAAAVLALYLFYPRGVPAPALPAATASRGVHLYVHITGEPENQATLLDLDSKGDL
jgi:hypothetical protein